MNEKKEVIRQSIIEISKLLNMKEVCQCANVNYMNYRKFKSGKLYYLSLQKLEQIIEVINNIHIDFESVPVTGTKERDE